MLNYEILTHAPTRIVHNKAKCRPGVMLSLNLQLVQMKATEQPLGSRDLNILTCAQKYRLDIWTR